MDNDLAIQDKAIDHIRELLTTHWREAKDSADENGKFSVDLCIDVLGGFFMESSQPMRANGAMTGDAARRGASSIERPWLI